MKYQISININDEVVKFFRKISKRKKIITMLILFSAASILYAANITKPHTFAAGEIVSAERFNENFDVLYNKVNELDNSVEELKNAGSSAGFGDYKTLSNGTVYQAEQDGFVFAWGTSINSSGTDCAAIYVGSSSSNLALMYASELSSGKTPSVIMPIKKGKYYKVRITLDGVREQYHIYWMPLGN